MCCFWATVGFWKIGAVSILCRLCREQKHPGTTDRNKGETLEVVDLHRVCAIKMIACVAVSLEFERCEKLSACVIVQFAILKHNTNIVEYIYIYTPYSILHDTCTKLVFGATLTLL